MKKNTITHAGSDPFEQSADAAAVNEEEPTDWTRVLAMTPDEVLAAARSDPDAQPMTRDQLARMRRVPNPLRIRTTLNQLTQQRFSRLFQIPLGTLRDWEQGVHFPDGASIAFLRVIEREPIAVALALNPDLTEQQIAKELGVWPTIVKPRFHQLEPVTASRVVFGTARMHLNELKNDAA